MKRWKYDEEDFRRVVYRNIVVDTILCSRHFGLKDITLKFAPTFYMEVENMIVLESRELHKKKIS